MLGPSPYNFIQVVDRVEGLSAAGCFYCGYGETCKVGAIYAVHGEGFKITEDNIPCVSKDAACMEKACQTGKNLGKILKEGHDRSKAVQAVRESLMARSGFKKEDKAL